jgi:hypothetical protein
VQIGGGVHVSDAFQAIVKFEPIVIGQRSLALRFREADALQDPEFTSSNC